MSGQLKLFKQLYEASDKRSEISGKPLHPPSHWQFHWQFQHCLPKGLYKRFKLHPENIVLMLPEEHTYVTEHEGEARKDPMWQNYFERKDQLKKEYYRK
jgi:hypothetical protein